MTSVGEGELTPQAGVMQQRRSADMTMRLPFVSNTKATRTTTKFRTLRKSGFNICKGTGIFEAQSA